MTLRQEPAWRFQVNANHIDLSFKSCLRQFAQPLFVFAFRAERRRLNPFAGQLASHGADFDVPLDVRKIRYQPVSNGGKGCPSKYFPDDMIGRFLWLKKIHAVKSPIFRESLTASHCFNNISNE
jgi:hypothetical protein